MSRNRLMYGDARGKQKPRNSDSNPPCRKAATTEAANTLVRSQNHGTVCHFCHIHRGEKHWYHWSFSHGAVVAVYYTGDIFHYYICTPYKVLPLLPQHHAACVLLNAPSLWLYSVVLGGNLRFLAHSQIKPLWGYKATRFQTAALCWTMKERCLIANTNDLRSSPESLTFIARISTRTPSRF